VGVDEDKFEHRARDGVKPNTFKITAHRRYEAMKPSGKDYKGDDYFLWAMEFETDEHPGWVFGLGGDETNFAYQKDDPKGTLYYQYGWSNWGPYWQPDPYVYEKFPLQGQDEEGNVVWEKDTWPPAWDENGEFDPAHEDQYYTIAEDLQKPIIEDIDVLTEKIGMEMDDKTTWEQDD